MIFECILSSSFENFWDDWPSFAISLNSQEKKPFFFKWPVTFFDSSSQVIMPSFTALFSTSFIEVGGDESPLLRSFILNKLDQKSILLGSPGSFGFLLVFFDGSKHNLVSEWHNFLKGRLVFDLFKFYLRRLLLWSDLTALLMLGSLDFDEPGDEARMGEMTHLVWSDL